MNLKDKKRIVIKVGTSTLTHRTGRLNIRRVEGLVKKVVHHKGNFHKAWLPKASTENERSTVVIETPDGKDVLVRQIAGAVARRIVTYAREDEDCYFDEHMGFIKFGSRVDVYLPTDTEVLVKMGQRTVGNQTVIAKLK